MSADLRDRVANAIARVTASKAAMEVIAEIEKTHVLVADSPTIVCLCGSGRFREAFEEAEFRETLAGKIVLTIGCNTKDIARDVDWSHVKPMLDVLHLKKIDLAHEVLIINVDGYIGQSTANELSYARAIGKVIRFWEPVDDEEARWESDGGRPRK